MRVLGTESSSLQEEQVFLTTVPIPVIIIIIICKSKHPTSLRWLSLCDFDLCCSTY